MSNKLGVVESRADLIVEQTSENYPQVPQFVEKLQDVTVQEVKFKRFLIFSFIEKNFFQEGVSISLSCQVRGDPAPEFSWLLNGKPVEYGQSFRSRAFDDGIATLEIVNVTKELCGTYTVVAFNQVGEAHSSAVVKLDHIEEKVRTTFLVLSILVKDSLW